jgi:ADP-ribose pyrophosphatase
MRLGRKLFGGAGNPSSSTASAASPGAPNYAARIENRRILLRHPFLTVEEVVLAPRDSDGAFTPVITRINVDRGDSVAALIYEPARRLLHFTRQFRFSTYDFDNEAAAGNGWLVELLAGRLADNFGEDELETPQAAMLREITEESNFNVLTIEQLSEFYLSPGASSERLYLFFATVERIAGRQDHTALGIDDEYIFNFSIAPDEFLRAVERGEVRDAKMICAAEWLRRNLDRLE